MLRRDRLEVEPERPDDASAVDDAQHRHTVLARGRHERLDAQRDGLGVGVGIGVGIGLGFGFGFGFGLGLGHVLVLVLVLMLVLVLR